MHDLACQLLLDWQSGASGAAIVGEVSAIRLEMSLLFRASLCTDVYWSYAQQITSTLQRPGKRR